MKQKEKFSTNFLNILAVCCLFYAPFSFLINFICAISLSGMMLHLWANVLIFLICFFLALIYVFWKEFTLKSIAVKLCVYIYTCLSIFINAFVMMIMDGSIWNLYSLILVGATSLIISVLYRFVPIRNYAISALMYYAVCLTAFLLLTMLIADYGTGNGAMILFGSFTAFFAICAFILYLVKRSIAKSKNEEKQYKSLFN